jgi:hypothetical protein
MGGRSRYKTEQWLKCQCDLSWESFSVAENRLGWDVTNQPFGMLTVEHSLNMPLQGCSRYATKFASLERLSLSQTYLPYPIRLRIKVQFSEFCKPLNTRLPDALPRGNTKHA